MPLPILTIAIPTYNRPRQLRATLDRLLPQASERIAILLVDNCSDIPAAESIARTETGTQVPVRLHRNPVNVGLAANITRCFELCDTEWLAVLSDDDEIAPDYVEALLDGLDRFPAANFINFSSRIHQRTTDFTAHGLAEFVERLDNWSNILFLSGGLYNRTRLVPFVRFGHIYGITLSPHMAIILRALDQEGGDVAFLSRNVVSYVEAETPTWPRLLLSNATLLLELIPERASQRLFLQKLRCYYPPTRLLAERLATEAVLTGRDQRFQFRLRSVLDTGPDAPLWKRLWDRILETLVAHPRVTDAALLKIRAITGKKRSGTSENETSAAI